MNQASSPAAPKLLSGRLLKVRLGLASVAVLVLGWWFAPPQASPLPASQEHAAPLLEEQVQLRDEPVRFRGVEDIAGRIAVRGVTLRPDGMPNVEITRDFSAAASDSARPSGFAIAIGDTDFVSHIDALQGSRSAQLRLPDGPAVSGTVVAFDALSGLVLLRTASTNTAATLADGLPATGALVIGAAAGPDARTVLPTFVTGTDADGFHVALSSDAMPGLPIYNVEGQLLGLVGRGERVASARTAFQRLRDQASAAMRPTVLGVAYQDVDGALRDLVGTSGAIVVDVIAGSPAERAGLREGDVIVASSGTPIGNSRELAAALMAHPQPEVELTVRRAGTARSMAVTRTDAYDVAVLARSETGRSAPAVAAVRPLTATRCDATTYRSTARSSALPDVRSVRWPTSRGKCAGAAPAFRS